MDEPTQQIVEHLREQTPDALDLTVQEHLLAVRGAADWLLERHDSSQSVSDFETLLVGDKDAIPLSVHLAAKLAHSKRLVGELRAPVHVSVVFAVYKEHNRIRTRATHPHGENFLVRKVFQLNWLFDGSPECGWDLTVVDDGCPEGSGRIAQDVAARKCAGEPVQVLFLADAIEQSLPVTQPMASTDDSNKGGAVEYGMWNAVPTQRDNHVVVFTDADLSTHLGQTGLLIDGIANRGADSAIGSRREPASVVVKKGVRNTRGKLFIYLWKRLVAPLDYLVDTQCGFKAFGADTVRDVIDDLIERRFAFDIELLMKTELRRAQSIVKVPVAWIDSEAGSTTTEIQPYLSMLKGIVAMYRKYLPPNPESDSFAEFIDGLDENTWNTIVDCVPAAIADPEPDVFSRFNEVKPRDLLDAAGW